METTDCIKRSLLRDLKSHVRPSLNPEGQLWSRTEYDRFSRGYMKASVQELYDVWRSLNADLISLPNPLCPWNGRSLRFDGPTIIRCVRQVVGFFSRIEGRIDEQEVSSQVLAFMGRIARLNTNITIPNTLVERARRSIRRWLGPCPRLAHLVPSHGPGAVSTGETGFQKAYFSETYFALDELIGEPSECLFTLNLNHPTLVLKRSEPTTKVVAVPKDLRRVRIISCEPLSMQFLQQAVARYIMRVVPLRCNHCILFVDQEVNRRESRYSHNATLDLSDASDTVSLELVKLLFPKDWFALLSALRSTTAEYKTPGGQQIRTPIGAFAPMGSALCFPIESIVFAALTIASIDSHPSRWKKPQRDIEKAVHIFGDDIIIPQEYAHWVIRDLERCGFVPNQSKCCYSYWPGFRESCGAEWYDGCDVSVTRPKTLSLSRQALTRDRAIPMVSYARQLLHAGFSATAQWFADQCRFPVALGEGSAYAPLGLRWPMLGKVRYNRALQRYEQRSCVAKAIPSGLEAVDGSEGLFMSFTAGWRLTSDEATDFPVRTRLSYAWLPILDWPMEGK